MTETSFPIVDKKLTDAAWGQAVGTSGDGVLDDWGGPYAITVNTNDTVTIRVSTVSGFARAVVNGFGHQLDAPVTLPVPAVTSATRYHVGLLYDPGNATDPVKLVVLKGSEVPLTAGQRFCTLHQFSRQSGQTLAASDLYSPRTRFRPTMVVDSATDLQRLSPLLFLRGTEVYCNDTGVSYRASGPFGSPTWALVDSLGLLLQYTDPQESSVTPSGGQQRVSGALFDAAADQRVLITASATVSGKNNRPAAGNVYVTLNDADVLRPASVRLARIQTGSQVMFYGTAFGRTIAGRNVLRIVATADSGSDTLLFQGARFGVTAY